MVAGADLGPGAADPADVGARELRDLRLPARAEREHVQALFAGAQAVRLTCPVHDAVAGPNLEGGAVEQADP